MIKKCLNIADKLQIANFKDKVVDLDIQKITEDIKKKLIDEDGISEYKAKALDKLQDEANRKNDAIKIREKIREISSIWKTILAADFEDLVGTP